MELQKAWGSCDFEIRLGYPFLINDEKLAEQVCVYARRYIGEENILDIDVWMASEDFSYSQVADSCFYMLFKFYY